MATSVLVFWFMALINALAYVGFGFAILILLAVGECPNHLPRRYDPIPFMPYCGHFTGKDEPPIECDIGFDWVYVTSVSDNATLMRAYLLFAAAATMPLVFFVCLRARFPPSGLAGLGVVTWVLAFWAADSLARGSGWFSPRVCADPHFPHRFEGVCGAQPIVDPPTCFPRLPHYAGDSINICLFGLCFNFALSAFVMCARTLVELEPPAAAEMPEDAKEV